MTNTVSAYVFAPPAIESLPVVGSDARFPVRRIYCVGRNYLAHIREMKEADDERDPPFFFQKPRDSLVQDGATVPYPVDSEDYQFEIELMVAIGASAKNLKVAEAESAIFGYGVALDMTRRDRQRECGTKKLPWERGKGFDKSAPCGPITPKALNGKVSEGAITLTVNGVEKQRGDLAQLIWNVPEIVANLSASYTLEPGDIIMTGTPAGVGPVQPGDVIVGAVDGFGTLTLTVGAREA
ncbi:5-carboxymethyl-2-hydroxymuconate isomerase [Azorhizobium oxalatiphilum]|uniref:5-carboxymethyl-2-hydroxymuconate isomerase n=1 Tax=Azorhizobium oxalatiphilum TaxID=980631 RepID=A0A917BL18_9HYPH|nr:fumarylacetoacetate hydrolase family protein [Azorhizobium oxalatiphilum]GGF48374.1 5-carboxymethyl-2-hydroxymuconate isomerase [Azorhizobium oxalatiphilum]